MSNSVEWMDGFYPWGLPTARKCSSERVPGRTGVEERGAEEGAMGLGPTGRKNGHIQTT